MADEQKARGPGSRILRERAMAQLRETRAKIDPQLLEAMKERFSALLPGGAHKPAAPVIDPLAAPVPRAEKAVYPAKSIEPVLPPESEPVDKQKIAQIVVEYMKRREEKSQH